MIDKYLKKLDFDDLILYYEIGWVEQGCEGCFDPVTLFYLTNDRTKWVKKYWIFGPLIEKLDNKVVFKIKDNIESYRLTQSDVYSMISREVKLMKRPTEIKNGMII